MKHPFHFPHRRTISFLILFGIGFGAHAQTSEFLTLEQCYELAKNNYPLIKQMALIEQAREYSIDNASKGYLPQIMINGQATYQSDVTQIPFSLPGVPVPTMSKDQYKIYAEINQPLTDVVIIKSQKELIETNSNIETQKTNVELNKLKERINQLFFGILLIDDQIRQSALLEKDIQTGIDKTTAGIENNIVLKSNLDQLKAEKLKLDQRNIELRANRKAYADMLTLFLNKPVTDNTSFQKPAEPLRLPGIRRPELALFETQKQTFGIQNKLLTAKTLPRVNLFMQGGYGRPALNMLTNDFKFYFIGGLRLTWNVSSFYTLSRDRELLKINESIIDIQQEIFLFNTNIALAQQGTEITRLQELITTDYEIIILYESIKEVAHIQLENGTISANDFLIAVNAEDKARQTLMLHQTQLLMAFYNYQTTSGN
jgi:outer membrane protein TolC